MDSSNSTDKAVQPRPSKVPPILRVMRLVFGPLGRLFPTLVGRWACYIWFSTRRSTRPKREEGWVQGARQELLELAGIKVMTYQWGDESKPLVVMVHGWNGRGSQMGAFAKPLVAAGFRVLSFDAPAHGQSPGDSTDIYKISSVLSAIAEDIAPIAHIIAHSFGGMVTSLSLSRGLEAKRVVLISSPARFEMLVDSFAYMLRMATGVRNNLVKRIEDHIGKQRLAQVSPTVNSQQLAHIPVLIIHDENDQDVPIDQAELIHQSWPNSELLKTQGLGHRRILYKPAVIDDVIYFLTA